jgi:hypothetical protein
MTDKEALILLLVTMTKEETYQLFGRIAADMTTDDDKEFLARTIAFAQFVAKTMHDVTNNHYPPSGGI